MDPLDTQLPPPRPSLVARLLRRVYAANPFYVVSAALVLYAIQLAGEHERGSWELLGLLGGYTAATAAAGVLVVRLGRVWDDARSIVLIVVGMLLVVSVGFDELALKDPELVRPRLLAGLGVAVALFEAMLAGLGIRLSLAYRLPYHALLAAFYLYPILVTDVVEVVHAANKDQLALVLAGWPVVVAAMSLGLVPAAYLGRRGIAGNGTPWPWPLFPWVAFVGVGVAAAMRAWLLCNAFYTGHGALDPFGAYLLIPLAFAVGVVALEGGLAERHAGVVAGALGSPLVALALAFPGSGANPARDEMLAYLRAYAGVPLGYATVAAIVFYAYAWMRGAGRAELGFVVALVAHAFAGPEVLAPLDLVGRTPAAVPIFAAGAYLVLSLAWARASWRLLGGVGLCAWSISLGLGTPEIDPTALEQIVVRHGLTLATVCVGALVATRLLFRDALARAAGWFVAPALTALLLAALFDSAHCAAAWPTWLVWGYAAALVAAPAAHARLARHAPSAGLAGLHAAVFAARVGVVVVELHRDPALHPAVLPVFWSAACFAVGLAISLAKGGALRAVWVRAAALRGGVDPPLPSAEAWVEAPVA